MGDIIFKNICKSFGNVKVIENLNLVIRNGEFTVLVGASGCGKTTLLRMIAGIGPATSGEIVMDGEDIGNIPPGQRDIAMVFQNYAIYPTMTVRGNIEFGLKNNKVKKAERNRLIDEVGKIVGLSEYMSRKPSELSGGQRQRVALARAMVKKPSVFLMDEPLSNLDAKLRGAMRGELIELHQRLKTTFVYVTHDQAEAMSMADTIILMEKGKIMQQGSPLEIYNNPDNVFTAQFIGTPPMNIFRVQDKFFGFRPEKAILTRERQERFYCRLGKVMTREILGSEAQYKIMVEDSSAIENGQTVMIKSSDNDFTSNDSVFIGVDEQHLYFFNAAEERIRKGDSNYSNYLSLVKGDQKDEKQSTGYEKTL